MATLGASPMRLDLRLPLTDASASAASAACERALDAWLGWMGSAADAGRALPAGAKQTQARRIRPYIRLTSDLHQTYIRLRRVEPTARWGHASCSWTSIRLTSDLHLPHQTYARDTKLHPTYIRPYIRPYIRLTSVTPDVRA